MRILLVEDNPGDVELTRQCLESRGDDRIELHVATDGVFALEFLRREGAHKDAPRPDLILLDLNLPRLDGRSVLRGIRAEPRLKHIPVIVLGSSTNEADINDCYELLANSYVNKPIGFGRYETILNATLDFWCAVAHLPASRS